MAAKKPIEEPIPDDWGTVILRATFRTDGGTGRNGRLIYLLTPCDRDGDQSELIRSMWLFHFEPGKAHSITLGCELEGLEPGDPAVVAFIRDAPVVPGDGGAAGGD